MMSNRITRNDVLAKRFGVTEDGIVDLPVKISNVRINITNIYNKCPA